MRKHILIFNFIILFIFVANAQKKTDNQFNSWWSYSGNHTLSDKWGVHSLVSVRRNDFVQNWQQSLVRFGMNYGLASNLTLTLGGDWVQTFPYGKQPIAKRVTEYRTFEQFILKNKVGILKFKHRYKLEQRYVSSKPVKHRFRYRFVAAVSLGGEDSKLSLTVFDEIFINIGGGVTGQYFNQNWIYIGLNYIVNKKMKVKLGYMNQYLMKSDNVHVESNHTLQVGVSYNLDFAKR